MKYIYILILFKLTIQVNAQNLKVEYNINYLINPDTIANVNEKIRYRNFLQDISEQTVYLDINNENSSFKTDHIKHPVSQSISALQTVYVNKSDKKIYLQNRTKHSYFPKQYSYRNFSEFNWQITTQSKVISGYTCYKAIGSLKFLEDKYLGLEVWFCPEFPFPFGPDIYAGLPGLVFEAYQADGKKYHFTLKSIKKENHKIEISKIQPSETEHDLVLLERLKNIVEDLKKQHKK